MAPLLALAGFMGCGKSSVGTLVAGHLGWDFIDLDEAFVASEDSTIAEFFARLGEAAFRERECDVLEQVLAARREDQGLVLALGGGTLESARARTRLKALGGVVYLEIDAESAWQRARGSGRPLATDEEAFGALLARRRRIYEDCASVVWPVEGQDVESLSLGLSRLVAAAGGAWQTLWGRRLIATERTSLVVGGAGSLRIIGERARQVREAGRRVYVISDRTVMAAWGERFLDLAGVPAEQALAIEPGEASKSPAMLAECWGWLADRGARRDDVVVAFGGGVVGDLAGFTAATYQRGVELWQVPTTLLAQVDSSIGGKTAIDLTAGKNLVGAFYQPDLVVADPVTLTTLRDEDFKGGLGEVVKHVLLISSEALDRLENAVPGLLRRDLATSAAIVKESVDFKARVVQQDEREGGVRAILNLGHTVGHALEVTEGYGQMSHGVAVALGLQVALAVSEEVLGLDRSVRERVRRVCEALGLPTSWPIESAEAVIGATGRDKKVRAGSSGFVGLRAPGDPVWGIDVSPQLLVRCMEAIRQ